MMARALVTGGAGALGSNLVQALLERGLEVVVLDDLSSGHRHLVPDDAEWIEGSVASEADLERCLDPTPDYVLHLAALFANQNSVDHPVEDLTVNGLGTLNVLRKSAERGVEKVLYTSSSCVYGHKELMREDDPDLHPHSPYAITKLLGEQYCRFWADHYGLDVVMVRLFNCYGPHEYPGRYRNVVPNFLDLAMAGRPLPITGTGQETRDFTYVSDTIEGMLGALFTATRPGEVLNIGSGRETRIVDLAHAVNALTGNGAGVAFQPRRSWDPVARRRSDIARARAVTGYVPSVSLEEGLRATHAWLAGVHV